MTQRNDTKGRESKKTVRGSLNRSKKSYRRKAANEEPARLNDVFSDNPETDPNKKGVGSEEAHSSLVADFLGGLEELTGILTADYIFSEDGESINMSEDDKAFLTNRIQTFSDSNHVDLPFQLSQRLGYTEEEIAADPEEFMEPEKSDNTYNWSWFLTPIDISIWKLETGKYVLELKVSAGGDPRGGYGDSYYSFFDGIEEAQQRIYEITGGTVEAKIKFDNGDYITYDSEQNSDVPLFYESDSVITSDEAEDVQSYLESLDQTILDEKLMP